MKTILTLCVVVLIAAGVLGWRATRMPTQYGKFLGAPKVQVADLIERPKDFLNKPVLIEGEVREQCKTMGCFFLFVAGDRTLRVDLQQVAMTAPMHEGRPARAEGILEVYGETFQLVATAVEFK